MVNRSSILSSTSYLFIYLFSNPPKSCAKLRNVSVYLNKKTFYMLLRERRMLRVNYGRSRGYSLSIYSAITSCYFVRRIFNCKPLGPSRRLLLEFNERVLCGIVKIINANP